MEVIINFQISNSLLITTGCTTVLQPDLVHHLLWPTGLPELWPRMQKNKLSHVRSDQKKVGFNWVESYAKIYTEVEVTSKDNKDTAQYEN